jgi:hypothetical protein
MSTDALRTLAVILAVAIVAAPYWRMVARALEAGIEWVRGHAASVSRLAAASLILAAAWGKVPLPTLPALPAVTVEVETPTPALQATVAPIAVALRGLPMGSRMTWAATWNKAGLVVAGEATAREVAFTDTRALQAFTGLALDIAWRRIGGHQPGSREALRKALESAYASEVGTDDVPTSPDIRARYVAFARAVAWAGLNGG